MKCICTRGARFSDRPRSSHIVGEVFLGEGFGSADRVERSGSCGGFVCLFV